MFRGIYSAATGMEIASRGNEVSAHNLAHANVPGFRQRGVSFQTFENALAGTGGNAPSGLIGGQAGQDYTDFQPGVLSQTGAPLDFALSGEGFFTLQGPDGPVYSRNGAFSRAPDGQLVNSGGLPVLGARGPITLPPGAAKVTVSPDGSVLADGQSVDRLRVVGFKDPTKLQPVGTTLFTDPGQAGPGASNATVLQGYREQSNVQLPTAMVTLIQQMRYFEASQRAMRTMSDSLGVLTRPQ